MVSEIKSLVQAWVTVFACLTFCYFIARKIPKGKPRLISLLPIVFVFTLLPMNLSSFHLGGITFLIISFITNFKLLLFAFDKGPLSSDQSLSLLHFISIACLPIKINHDTPSQTPPNTQNVTKKQRPSHETLKKGLKSPLNYVIKFLVLALVSYTYTYRQYMSQYLILALYWCNLYLAIEIIFAMSVAPALAMLGFEIEPQFEEPYLSTSVQNFWGKRWNCTVSNALRSTIYYPVRTTCAPIIGKRWALTLAVMTSFFVSGLMHELFYFYATSVEPTWEVTCFFILQGAWTAMEIEMKKALKGGRQLHPVVSRVLAIGFVMVTSFWLMFPQIIRNGVDVKAVGEYGVLTKFVKVEVLRLWRSM